MLLYYRHSTLLPQQQQHSARHQLSLHTSHSSRPSALNRPSLKLCAKPPGTSASHQQQQKHRPPADKAKKQQQQQPKPSRSAAARSKATTKGGTTTRKPPSQQQQPAAAAGRSSSSSSTKQPASAATSNWHHDHLDCVHFGPCAGCSLQHNLWQPPVAAAAREFFSSRGLLSAAGDAAGDAAAAAAAGDVGDVGDVGSGTQQASSFVVHPGPVHGWRCRAKLAVRGGSSSNSRSPSPAAADGSSISIGMFESGSHFVTPIPECRAHHPRINAAVQLVQQVSAGLGIKPYQEQQQSQQQQQVQQSGSSSSSKKRQPSANSSSSSSSGGFLRYLQLTVLPSEAGGRAEEDAQAQVQLVLVWAAPDASHPSFADAKRLAAALWSQGGPKTPSPLAALRARAEAAAASKAGKGTGNRSSSGSSKAGSGKAALAGGGGSSSGSVSASGGVQSTVGSAVVVNRNARSPTPPPAGSVAGGSSSSSSSSSSNGPQQPSPLLHSIWINFQPHPDSNRVLGDSWQLMHGPETGWQEFGGVQLAVQPGSFVQANYGAMQRCLSSISAAVRPGSSVLELYAGSGVIGLSLAARTAAAAAADAQGGEAPAAAAATAAVTAVSKVVCVEINPLARQPFDLSLQRLAATNKAAAGRVSHVVASAADADGLQQMLAQQYRLSGAATAPKAAAAAGRDCVGPDVLIVDPPRKGLDAPLLQLLTQQHGDAATTTSSSSSSSSPLASVQRLIYLSCGFEALKSDTDALLAAGWRVVSAEAFLFFPGTDSIETLAVFERCV